MIEIHHTGLIFRKVRDQILVLTNLLGFLRDSVMTSHEAYTSGTSRVLTVASLQRLKMEALIPTHLDSEVRYVITFLNAQSIAPIEIHHQLC